MRCDDVRRTLLSPDGPVLPDAAEHVRTCASCHAVASVLATLDAQVLAARAVPAPDLTEPLLAAWHRGAPGRQPARLARIVLAAVALAQVAVALPLLTSTRHSVRELAAFTLALAIGQVVAAARPVDSGALLPVVATVAALLAAITLLDVRAGHVPAWRETPHLLAVAGAVALWRLRRTAGTAATATTAAAR